MKAGVGPHPSPPGEHHTEEKRPGVSRRKSAHCPPTGPPPSPSRRSLGRHCLPESVTHEIPGKSDVRRRRLNLQHVMGRERREGQPRAVPNWPQSVPETAALGSRGRVGVGGPKSLRIPRSGHRGLRAWFSLGS